MLNSNILEATLSVKQAVQKIFEAKFDNYEKVKAKKGHEELMIVRILFSEVSGCGKYSLVLHFRTEIFQGKGNHF